MVSFSPFLSLRTLQCTQGGGAVCRKNIPLAALQKAFQFLAQSLVGQLPAGCAADGDTSVPVGNDSHMSRGLAEGDVLGSVLFVAEEGDLKTGETEQKLLQTVSGFLHTSAQQNR